MTVLWVGECQVNRGIPCNEDTNALLFIHNQGIIGERRHKAEKQSLDLETNPSILVFTLLPTGWVTWEEIIQSLWVLVSSPKSTEHNTVNFHHSQYLTFYKVAANIKLANTNQTIISRRNTVLGSYESLVTTFLSTSQYITLLFICFCLKTPYLTYVVDLSNAELTANSTIAHA